MVSIFDRKYGMHCHFNCFVQFLISIIQTSVCHYSISLFLFSNHSSPVNFFSCSATFQFQFPPITAMHPSCSCYSNSNVQLGCFAHLPLPLISQQQSHSGGNGKKSHPSMNDPLAGRPFSAGSGSGKTPPPSPLFSQ
jgi:hypothetical protein